LEVLKKYSAAAFSVSIASIAVDVKAWTRFFLEDGGMHWKKLRPQPGMNWSYWVKWDMFETVGYSWDIHSWDICIQDHPSISIYRHYLQSSNRSISFRCHLFLYLSKCRSARWFTANQLKPRRGFRATVLQIGFMMELWFVRSSVSVELEEICLTLFIRGFLEWP